MRASEKPIFAFIFFGKIQLRKNNFCPYRSPVLCRTASANIFLSASLSYLQLQATAGRKQQRGDAKTAGTKATEEMQTTAEIPGNSRGGDLSNSRGPQQRQGTPSTKETPEKAGTQHKDTNSSKNLVNSRVDSKRQIPSVS